MAHWLISLLTLCVGFKTADFATITNISKSAPDRSNFTENRHLTKQISDTVPDPNCPECHQQLAYQSLEKDFSKDEMRSVMIELFKMKLLEKLHLKEPPISNVLNTSNSEIPLPLLSDVYGNMQADKTGIITKSKTRRASHEESSIEKVVVFGKEEWNNSSASRWQQFEFHIGQDIWRHAVRRVSLWLYTSGDAPGTNSTGTIYVSDCHGELRTTTELPGVPGRIVAQQEFQNNSWLRLDVTVTVRDWSRHHRAKNTLSVTCVGCSGTVENFKYVYSDAPHQPFLNVELKRRSRIRRSAAPVVEGGCYLENLYISFAEIGWQWIKHPPGYRANYCRGSCINHNVLQNHSRVMRELMKSNTRDSRGLNDVIAPCCAAVGTSSISIVYEVAPNELHYRVLHDMAASSCDCR